MQSVLLSACLTLSHTPVHAEGPHRDEHGAEAHEEPQAGDVADPGHEKRAQKMSEPARKAYRSLFRAQIQLKHTKE